MAPDIAKELHKKIEVLGIEVILYSACITQQIFLVIDEDLGHDFCEKLQAPFLSMEVVELVVSFVTQTIGGIIYL